MLSIFTSATIKLTAWYLAMVMALSIAFSTALYYVSAQQLHESFERQTAALRESLRSYVNLLPHGYDFGQLRQAELADAKQKLLANLILYNTAILVLGASASFYMARRTLRPIERAMEAQARFTVDASHELRTPLTAMQTEIEVALRDENLSLTEAKSLLASNLEEVGKLHALSNSLLALAREDKEQFKPRRLRLKPIMADALRRAKPLASQKQIVIENQLQDYTVLGDKAGLVQLLSILLDNAIKYSPAATTITLSSRAKGGSALVSIQDHGYGIQAGDLPHIFDRLYRADNSRSKGRVEGYGLGLSIAKKIIEVHGGAIEVTSRRGKGSTFTVRLPLSPTKQTPEPR